MKYGEEHWKKWKMRNAHYRIENMARILKKLWKWDKNSVWPGILRDTEKRGKWKMYTVGPGVWQKTENNGQWETNTVWPGI